jgi:dephospho-CoA kinase
VRKGFCANDGAGAVLIIGLTGSIGMGKSTTAEMFRLEGVPVHDSDRAVHELYASAAVAPINAAFPGVVDAGGVNRAKLAKIVLSTPQALKRLEEIVHPLVVDQRDRFLERARDRLFPICVLDVPLLFETGIDRLVDLVVVVTADAAVQKQRVLARPGMTEDKFEAILSRQTADAEKRRRAHCIIDTSFGLEDARRQVVALLRALSR